MTSARFPSRFTCGKHGRSIRLSYATKEILYYLKFTWFKPRCICCLQSGETHWYVYLHLSVTALNHKFTAIHREHRKEAITNWTSKRQWQRKRSITVTLRLYFITCNLYLPSKLTKKRSVVKRTGQHPYLVFGGSLVPVTAWRTAILIILTIFLDPSGQLMGYYFKIVHTASFHISSVHNSFPFHNSQTNEI